ncbi:hypothetical protein K402DRAFT_51005 [Aulographum hederae CBS 113979]|uniref:Uncharacterized protein n=1 Tax=Aulographum hederae CBS 113979 TaxID=1176131 RepID=A0A6G1H2T2_9PEZI|nr:hypothetical protein K402DRAFT_51005 [Aulographum hederae CBS 113979]
MLSVIGYDDPIMADGTLYQIEYLQSSKNKRHSYYTEVRATWIYRIRSSSLLFRHGKPWGYFHPAYPLTYSTPVHVCPGPGCCYHLIELCSPSRHQWHHSYLPVLFPRLRRVEQTSSSHFPRI